MNACVLVPVISPPEGCDLLFRSDGRSASALIWRHRRTGIAGISLLGTFDGDRDSITVLQDAGAFLIGIRCRLLVWDLSNTPFLSPSAIVGLANLHSEMCTVNDFESALVVNRAVRNANDISASLRGCSLWTGILEAVMYLYINQWQA
jgi:hypothetical protein